MKKVLIVAYGFPPVGGAGVQRPVKFVKYLRRFGWEPVVLTVSNPSVPLMDTTLPKDIPDGVKIYGASTFEPSYKTKQSFSTDQVQHSGIKKSVKKIISTLLLPDVQVLWWPGLAIKLIKVIKTEKPLCLFVTAPPFSSFIPVVAIGKLFKIPVVIDYRDEWIFARNSWENSSRTRLAFKIDTLFEKFALANCCAFTTATQSYIISMANLYGKELINKGVPITNGYDVDDFVVSGKVDLAIKDHSIVTIIYTGTVMKATSLNVFCQLLKRFMESEVNLKNKILVKIYGRVVGDEQTFLDDEALKSVIECYGYVEHEKVVEEVMNADLLLLTLSDLTGAEKIINGKAFEYMASGRHIFSLIPDGELKSLIASNYDNATIIHPRDFDSAYNAFVSLINNIEELRNRKGKDVSCFLRENLTAKLATVFDRISKC